MTDASIAWALPTAPRPIVVIGAGGIVRDAHLPAYYAAGLPVAGLYDLDETRACALAAQWSTGVFHSLDEALDVPEAVFDVAVPPVAQRAVLERLPRGATVLLQKPFGLTLTDANQLLAISRARSLVGAVNFQLRFAPMMLALAQAVQNGRLGKLTEIDVRIDVATPWHLFPHLLENKRVEIVSHSIHYIDAIRGIAGNPSAVLARTLSHPDTALAQSRSTILLDYSPALRAQITTNHHHSYGPRFESAWFRVEGTDGAAACKLGALLDYPHGKPDEFWIVERGGAWEQIRLPGDWFPSAFSGVMSNLQRFVAGEDDHLLTGFADAYRTMAVVEACYRAAETPGTIPIFEDFEHGS